MYHLSFTINHSTHIICSIQTTVFSALRVYALTAQTRILARILAGLVFLLGLAPVFVNAVSTLPYLTLAYFLKSNCIGTELKISSAVRIW